MVSRGLEVVGLNKKAQGGGEMGLLAAKLPDSGRKLRGANSWRKIGQQPGGHHFEVDLGNRSTLGRDGESSNQTLSLSLFCDLGFNLSNITNNFNILNISIPLIF